MGVRKFGSMMNNMMANYMYYHVRSALNQKYIS